MFKEKYKSDNNLIVPDKALISSLAEKMKSYQEPDTNPVKLSKKYQTYFKTAGILTCCVCILVISATAFYFAAGSGTQKKSAEDIKESSITTESASKDTFGSGMSESKKEDTLLERENQWESTEEECQKDEILDILTSDEIEKVEILILSGSENNTLTITDSSDINQITDFFNTLYNSIDKSILIDIDINESKGNKIETTFYMKDGTKQISTIYNDSYFKMDNTEWLSVNKEDLIWYKDFLRHFKDS